ncbi:MULTISPECIES: hypothetical protein [unclassified Paraburkholderia]|uniref:hypothetical protein n=1 Tax=unclassified Paraburkholderia TaxID=2615204 RepID=UPI00182D8CAA|nr:MULTISPECIES: hypothetical protein [unclassified Paraburkholderia]MBB5408234.1 hypothetical protein [Paraburkholderia sp. HC6.4b]MBB5455758.1 hypothetical protein [Paraburkholderia sp. Kb1A]
MSEAELHLLRARLDGIFATRPPVANCAAACPPGWVWGEADGEVRLHPDEAVVGALRTVFARFGEGSVAVRPSTRLI